MIIMLSQLISKILNNNKIIEFDEAINQNKLSIIIKSEKGPIQKFKTIINSNKGKINNVPK